MPLPFAFDWKHPDYVAVFHHRAETLRRIRADPDCVPLLRTYYKTHIADFIDDWGTTYDPRNVARGLPSLMPFILFPKQREWIEFFLKCWRENRPGLTDKSREMGMSWLTMAVASSICALYDGVEVGVGSRKEEYVDHRGDPKSLFWKARKYVSNLPAEFRGTWDERKHSPYMRIEFPDTQSIITGEAGDNIGRGARAAFYFVDEAAWLPRPELVEASLAETTNCRQDISTPHGMNNPFARKRHGGRIDVFTFHWRDDPRKDQAWYEKKCFDIDDPVVIAQEIDLDYNASQEGVLIPAMWIQAAIDAHVKLGITPTGARKAAYDVADEGKDKNALAGRLGVVVEYLEEWSGKDCDLLESTERVFRMCDVLGYHDVDYDADGLGAGVRGDARHINTIRKGRGVHTIKFNPFHGSGSVTNPLHNPFRLDGEFKDGEKGRTNEDYYENYNSQSWFALRRRFMYTYRAVVKGIDVPPQEIISLPSTLDGLGKLIAELGQPVIIENTTTGKMLVDKAPNGAKSPNKADAIKIVFAPIKQTRGAWSK